MTVVGRIMRKHVITAQENNSIRAVWILFLKSHLSAIPVINQTNNLAGIVSKTDILRMFYPNYREYYVDVFHVNALEISNKKFSAISNKQVKNIMQQNVYFVRPETDIMHALARMIARGVKQLPVIDNAEKFVGLISKDDIFTYIYRLHTEVFSFRRYRKPSKPR